ncbi:MAG: GTP-binding protein [Planctomycetota bacterium]
MSDASTLTPASDPKSFVARYVMIGGFLGAGKSTSVSQFAKKLGERGKTVGLITNDQGDNLVDSAYLRASGFRVEEISGGCFCCRFDSLRSAAAKLTDETRPDVILAEPVGSCTDLVATVSYPLRRIYGDSFRVAPLSVLVDPTRARRVLGLEQGRKFSSRVTYVYRKQLEEASVLVINKCDTLDGESRAELREALANEYPDAKIFEVSARSGEGLDEWFDYILDSEMGSPATLKIDYDIYAEGEALLGWLNATVYFDAESPVDADETLAQVARDYQAELDVFDVEIAHLKLTLSPISDDCSEAPLAGAISSVNLVRSDFVPETAHRLEADVDRAQIIVNVRAETEPRILEHALRNVLDRSRAGVSLKLDHFECFQPGRPTPTHRDVASPSEPGASSE